MDIQPRELQQRLARGEALQLIDIREPNAYEADKLGGLLLPLDELRERVGGLQADRQL